MPVGLWISRTADEVLLICWPPAPRGPEHLHLDVLGPQLHVHLLHLRQHGHRGRGGVDAAAGLRLRHPLDPVDAALELQPGVGAGAVRYSRPP